MANKTVIDTYKPIPPIEIDLDTDDTELIVLSGKVSDIINGFIDKNPNIDLYTGDGLSVLFRRLNKRIHIDIKDIDSLNRLWDVYIYICLYFKVKPTMLRFSILIGVGNDTLSDWIQNNRHYAIGSDELGSFHSQSAKKWRSQCESSLYDEVIKTGNIGCMFALKANYGYRENVDITVTNKDANAPHKTLEEIAADYGQQLAEGKTKVPAADF